MAKQTRRQKQIVGRVMHEFKHGELETRGRKIRNPRQAIAIGLSEAGASNRKSAAENRRNRKRTETKERRGQTAQQRKEGRGRRGRPAGASGETRAELYAKAQRRGLRGCSRMSKAELQRVLRRKR